MRKQMNKFTKLAAIVALLVFAGNALGTVVLHRNLQQLSDLSERVFWGKCVSRVEFFQPGGKLPPYTEYTFEVFETFKGQVGSTITFRQFGLTSYRQWNDQLVYVGIMPDMPIYQEGHEYILFLIGDSQLGLTSPVGLYQGSFQVIREPNGVRKVVNGMNNSGLFKDMSEAGKMEKLSLTSSQKKVLANRKGPIDYDAFISVTRKLIQAK